VERANLHPSASHRDDVVSKCRPGESAKSFAYYTKNLEMKEGFKMKESLDST